ncbi:MAG: hypothetical protein ACLRFI_01410 [Alphaproteobacteria bacterium]
MPLKKKKTGKFKYILFTLLLVAIITLMIMYFTPIQTPIELELYP